MSKFLYFDGTNTYMDVNLMSPSNAVAPSKNGGAITIEFWNYVRASDVQNSYAFSFQTKGVNLDVSRTSCHAPWNNKQIYWDYGAWDKGGRVQGDYSKYLDKWTHVALVCSGLNTSDPKVTLPSDKQLQAIYLDGELFQSQKSATSPSHVFDQLLIGADFEDNKTILHHKGWMTDFRVWNTMRSANDIKRSKYTRVTGKEAGLIASYDFLYDGALPSSLTNKVANKPACTLHGFSDSGVQPPSSLPIFLVFTAIDDKVTVKLGNKTLFDSGIVRVQEYPVWKDITADLEDRNNNIDVTLENVIGSSELRGFVTTQDETTIIDFSGILPDSNKAAKKTYTIKK